MASGTFLLESCTIGNLKDTECHLTIFSKVRELKKFSDYFQAVYIIRNKKMIFVVFAE